MPVTTLVILLFMNVVPEAIWTLPAPCFNMVQMSTPALPVASGTYQLLLLLLFFSFLPLVSLNKYDEFIFRIVFWNLISLFLFQAFARCRREWSCRNCASSPFLWCWSHHCNVFWAGTYETCTVTHDGRISSR